MPLYQFSVQLLCHNYSVKLKVYRTTSHGWSQHFETGLLFFVHATVFYWFLEDSIKGHMPKLMYTDSIALECNIEQHF